MAFCVWEALEVLVWVLCETVIMVLTKAEFSSKGSTGAHSSC